MNRTAAALAAALVSIALPASAESAFEMAFRNGTLDAFHAGDRLDYASTVSTPADGAGEGTSTIIVGLGDDGSATLEQLRDGTSRPLGRFDADVGNPLAMYFLERTIRSVSDGTGGSDFYLRNRIKDSLRAPEEVRQVEVDWQGERIDATEIVLAPFEGDPNVDRLGPYADLEIRLVVGEGIPGWYHTLRAEAGEGAFASALTLSQVAR